MIMRKIAIIMITVMGFGLTLQAQDKEDFTSKRGVYILPEAGDIGLGFNAAPVFNYMGNMLNGSVGNSLFTNYISDQAIIGKYYLSDKTAIRGELRIGYNHNCNNEFIMEDASIPDPEVLVTDKRGINSTNIHLGAGYEMRRGNGRLQGYYGGMLTIDYARTNVNYDYGNAITSEFNSPYTTDFGANITGSGRITEVKNLTNMGIGARGFIGVEYFFAPKISIGGEFGWGPAFNITTSGEQTAEVWTGTEVKETTDELAKDNNIGLDTDNASGGIFLIFHF
jgi:hypothetical protein